MMISLALVLLFHFSQVTGNSRAVRIRYIPAKPHICIQASAVHSELWRSLGHLICSFCPAQAMAVGLLKHCAYVTSITIGETLRFPKHSLWRKLWTFAKLCVDVSPITHLYTSTWVPPTTSRHRPQDGTSQKISHAFALFVLHKLWELPKRCAHVTPNHYRCTRKRLLNCCDFSSICSNASFGHLPTHRVDVSPIKHLYTSAWVPPIRPRHRPQDGTSQKISHTFALFVLHKLWEQLPRKRCAYVTPIIIGVQESAY